MAEATGFTIGAQASCTDGFCGEVTRLIIDSAALTVTHLVVDPKRRREPGRRVPVDLVDITSGEVRLRCSLAEFEQLDVSEVLDLVEGPGYAGGYGGAESVQGYGNVGSMGVGGSATGMGIGTGLGHTARTVAHDAVELGETEVSGGDHVHAVDGEIGQVQGFLVNPSDHHVSHVLLREGHLWGRKEVAIPVSAVSAVDDGIKLSISKKEVENLPPLG
jgi:sporulation protein YlmC with PRC-barrel domain